MFNNRRYQFTFVVLSYCLLTIIILTYLNYYAVNWPHAEDFVSVDWYNQMVNQKMIGPTYLWRLSNGGHPLASQALITTALFFIAGINFRALIQLDALIVLGSSITLSSLLIRQLGVSWPSFLGSFVLVLVFFHPIQISHLLWGFELGWFLINLMLVLNAVVIESSLKYRLAVVLVFCFVGAFSSAQGSVLWAVAAFHLFLKDIRRYKYPILVFSTVFGLNVFHVLSITPKEVTQSALSSLSGLAVYCVQLLGTVFWSRDHTHLLWAGMITFSLAILVVFRAATSYKTNKIQRVALVISTASLIFIIQFACARLPFGLDWALSEFHMATLLIPLLAGLTISSAEWFSSSARQPVINRLAVLAPCLYITASFLYSAAPATAFAKEFKVKEEVARQKNGPPFVVHGLNLGPQFTDFYWRTIHLLDNNCKAQDSWRTARLLTYPRYFVQLAQQRPAAQDALEALWETYLVNFDLSRAFPPTDPREGEHLLAWAVGNARTGSHYPSEILKAHEQAYLSLAQP